MSDAEPTPTIRCRALLNFRCMRFGVEYDLPDDERTWMYLGMGLLEEVWEDTWEVTDDGPMLRGDETPDA